MNPKTEAPVVIPTKSKFEPKLVEVDAPSGRKYVLRELTGFESMQASAGVETIAELVVYRVAHSIDSIDGEPILARASRSMLDVLLRSISSTDLDCLADAYRNAFSAEALAKHIKNESAPSD